MLRTISVLSCLVPLAAGASAQDSYSPPPIGTMVTWSFGNESDRETRISEVVANGSDFVIYMSDLRLDSESPASYLVEFSGLHTASCSGKIPNTGERKRLASAWPLKSGETVEVSGELGATYTIGKLRSHTLNVSEGPTQVRQIKASYGKIENDIILSLNWNIPVAVAWADGTGDRALEILPPTKKTTIKRRLRESLGNCAKLLDE